MASVMPVHRHPLTELLLLAGIAFGCFIIFTFLGAIAGYFFYGLEDVRALSTSTASVEMQKLFLSFSSVGMFVIPPFIIARLQSRKYLDYLQFYIPKPWFIIILVFIIMVSVTPFIEWAVYVNQQLKLPDSLSAVENWMRYKEMEAEVLTKQLLVMSNTQVLIVNLAVIAIIPAVGEELIFRGCIQKFFTKWTNNPHLGIWIAAIIFSAIHFQFYGFLPRMLLGGVFGYLLFFSKSIWVPVFAHFYNNGSAVISAYFLQSEGKSLENLTKPAIQSGYVVTLSIIFTAMLFIVLYKLTSEKNRINE